MTEATNGAEEVVVVEARGRSPSWVMLIPVFFLCVAVALCIHKIKSLEERLTKVEEDAYEGDFPSIVVDASETVSDEPASPRVEELPTRAGKATKAVVAPKAPQPAKNTPDDADDDPPANKEEIDDDDDDEEPPVENVAA